MTPTIYQKPEIRDSNDNIIQQGAFGKNTALANATNDGWIDYVANDLEFLYDLAKDEVVPVSALPASGDMNKTYLLTTTGVCYRWDGTEWVEISSSEAVGRAEAAANLAEQWATKTDGTVADNEYSAKYYANSAQQSADDAQDVADDMADHLAQIDQNTGGVSANSKRIGNIEKLLQGNLYDYQTDSTSAYTKSVPSGAMPYAGLEQIGGKTVVMNQLCVLSTSIASQHGVTFTINDGVITTSGTADADFWVQAGVFYQNDNASVGDKLLFKMTPNGTADTFYVNIATPYWSVVYDNIIFTKSADTSAQAIRFYIKSGTNMDGKQISFVGANLTKMFGAGNEPTTVAEFEAMFPASYYAYNAGTLLSAGVTEVVSKDSNNSTLQTYSVPAEIQALEGYGWSAGSVYNYVDFERKVFVQKVAQIVCDGNTETWTATSTVAGGTYRYTLVLTNNAAFDGDATNIQNVVCNMYNTVTALQQYNSKIGIAGNTTTSIYVRDATYTTNDIAAWKSHLATLSQQGNPLIIQYELATPVETDISAYLTDDNLISVESGGTLTFENSNGDDYRIPLPSEETYMIDLQEAINNG